MTAETPSFTAGNHRWPLRITPPTARRIRDQMGIDLFAVSAPPDRNPFFRLAEDPLLLADVLWQILQPLAAERGLDRDAFEDVVWPHIDDAVTTLLDAVIASFPEKKRAGLRRLIDAQNAALDKVLERMTPNLDKLIDTAVDEAVAAAGLSTHTN